MTDSLQATTKRECLAIKNLLWEVFTHLHENNMTVNMEECMIAQPMVTFLGHGVDSKGIRPLPEKVAAIHQFLPPTSKLLGMTNFYCYFLPCLTHIVRPLTDSLATSKREFTVTEDMLRAFTAVKNLISNAKGAGSALPAWCPRSPGTQLQSCRRYRSPPAVSRR